jgi:hypothetical protein
VKFFFDNCVAWRIAEALAVLLEHDGFEIVPLRAKFPENAPDEVWLPALGREGGWTVISGDVRIFKNKPRKLVWASARLTTFFLSSSWMGSAFTERQKAARLLERWDEIVEEAAHAAPGTAFHLPFKGKISRAS